MGLLEKETPAKRQALLYPLCIYRLPNKMEKKPFACCMIYYHII